MIINTIDLYDYYGIPRNGANGGYLTSYIRTKSAEIKERIRPAIIIIPGGGYEILSDREAEPVAIKFLNNGFCAFALSYSLRTKYPTPLVEAMLAMRFVRDNVVEYNIDKNKVCVMGFSAGGHLAGLLATSTREERELIGEDAKSVCPDAVLLSYPVVTMTEYTHDGSRSTITGGDKTLFEKLSVEKRVDKYTPPMFIWHTFEDDCVPTENSLMLAAALRQNGIPFALHVFEEGRHGLSVADEETCDFLDEQGNIKLVSKWFELALDWLAAKDFKVKVLK